MAIQLRTELPGPKSRALLERRARAVCRGPFHATPLFIARATGAQIEDVDGNRLLDFSAGIGVVNVGHAAKEVVEAIGEQAGRYLHAGFNVTPYEGYVEVAERLNRATPGDSAKKTLLVNSGAEAVENAVKIARAYTGRQAVVGFQHGFHGRTYMALSLTSKARPYKEGFGPYCPEVYRAPFPYAYRWPGSQDPTSVSAQCFEAFEELCTRQLSVNEIAAVVIEPVLGEGGFVPAPRDFLERLRAFCTRHGIVLVADEIQTGFGRTGTLFASEQLGLVPDLIVTAKGLAGGMPLAAVTGRAEVMDAPVEGGVGGTFGGNPLSCAAALAVFRIFEDPGLMNHGREIGRQLRETLTGFAQRFDVVGEARGLGPMQAVELVKSRSGKEPNPEAAKAVTEYAYKNGVVALTAGPYGNSVRFLMPLVISSAELEEGLSVIEAGLQRLP